MKRIDKGSSGRLPARLLIACASSMLIIGVGRTPPGTVRAAGHPAAHPAISIAAKTSEPLVTGYTWTELNAAGHGEATLQGKTTGVSSTAVVRLFAQRFPFTAKPLAGPPVALTWQGPTGTYSYRVSVPIAVKYFVGVYATAKSLKPLVTSRTVRIFVSYFDTISPKPRTCGQPQCHQNLHISITMPHTALRAEMAKKRYGYFGVTRSKNGEPPPPHRLKLDPAVHISKPVGTGFRSYKIGVKISFYVGNGGYNWSVYVCLKDTVGADGVGLPGHHACGDATIPHPDVYVG